MGSRLHTAEAPVSKRRWKSAPEPQRRGTGSGTGPITRIGPSGAKATWLSGFPRRRSQHGRHWAQVLVEASSAPRPDRFMHQRPGQPLQDCSVGRIHTRSAREHSSAEFSDQTGTPAGSSFRTRRPYTSQWCIVTVHLEVKHRADDHQRRERAGQQGTGSSSVPFQGQTIRLALPEVLRRDRLAGALARQGKVELALDQAALREPAARSMILADSSALIEYYTPGSPARPRHGRRGGRRRLCGDQRHHPGGTDGVRRTATTTIWQATSSIPLAGARPAPSSTSPADLGFRSGQSRAHGAGDRPGHRGRRHRLERHSLSASTPITIRSHSTAPSERRI